MTNTTKIARTPAFRTGALLALASGLLAFAAPAFAQNDDVVPQSKLNVASTDFTSAKAVDHLKARVRRVAFQICVPDGQSLAPIPADQRKCINTAMHNGMAQIDSKQQQAMRATTVNMASAQTDTHPAH